jgi:hypothetical protein
MIEAGLVATGMQCFWIRAMVGLVFLAAVVFHLTVDEPQRLVRFSQVLRVRGPLQRRPAPQMHEPPWPNQSAGRFFFSNQITVGNLDPSSVSRQPQALLL